MSECLYDNCIICSQIKEEDKDKQKIPMCLFVLMLYTFNYSNGTREMMNKGIEGYQEEELIQSGIY